MANKDLQKREDVSECHNKYSQKGDSGFPIEKPTGEELEALMKGKKELDNGESYTHEAVFREEDLIKQGLVLFNKKYNK